MLETLRDILFGDHRASRAALELRAVEAGGLVPRWQVGKPQYLPREISSYDQHAYRRVGLIFRAVQYLANAAGTAPLRVYHRHGDEPQEDDAHPLRALMQHPNPGMGEARFLSFIAMTMAVAGFVVIEKERDRDGNVIGLWPLRSDWIRPVLRNQDAPDWEYRVPGYERPFLLDARDVIAVPYADTPDNSPVGIGPLEVLLRETGITSTLTDFLKTFMDRGAMPLYTLIPSDDPRYMKQWEDQSIKEAFMDGFRRRYAGLTNAVDPMPLVGVKDIKPLGLDFNQLAYPELNALTDARICTGFGIPPILLGAQVGLEQATYSNYGQARTSFYEDTMTYLWGRLDDAFTRHLLPEFTDDPATDVMFDVTKIPALQDDENERVTRAVSMFSSGLVSRHNGQRMAGVKPHGSDVFLVPFNMVEQANTNGQRRRATVEVLNGEYRQLPEPAVVTRDGRQYLNERALAPEQRSGHERVAARHRAAILRHADRAEPIVAEYLAEQRERIVEAIAGAGRQAGAEIHTRAIEAIDWNAEGDELRRLLEQWLDSLGADAFSAAAMLTGTDDMWSVSNQYLRELIDLLGRRIVGITEVTRRDVERVVIDALTEGTSMPDLAGKLRGLYDETYNGRSMAIARTESQVAYNTASAMSYQASGTVSQALLYDNPAHTTDPGSDGLTCAQRNNLIVPLALVGRHIAGEHVNGTLAVGPYIAPEGA